MGRGKKHKKQEFPKKHAPKMWWNKKSIVEWRNSAWVFFFSSGSRSVLVIACLPLTLIQIKSKFKYKHHKRANYAESACPFTRDCLLNFNAILLLPPSFSFNWDISFVSVRELHSGLLLLHHVMIICGLGLTLLTYFI